MTSTITRRVIPTLAVLALLMAMAVGHAAAATSAAAAPNSADRLMPAPGGASSAALPTLTNDVGQPGDGADPALPFGAILLAAGLLGVAVGLTDLKLRLRAVA